jgi:hypothetical protein
MPSEDKLDTVKLAQAINLARRYSVQNEYDLMQVRFFFLDLQWNDRVEEERLFGICCV